MNRENGSQSAILSLPIEERVDAEKKKTSLASTFDQLIAVNIQLAGAVQRLVRVVYILVALDALHLLYGSFVK